MKVVVNEEKKVSVGDIIEFNHNGSHNAGGFYLICHSDDGYFILNLSGEKARKIRYYSNLDNLIGFHGRSIVKIYSQNEWNITLKKN